MVRAYKAAMIFLTLTTNALAEPGGAPHSHASEGPLLMKLLGGAIIVIVSLVVYFGFIQKKKK